MQSLGIIEGYFGQAWSWRDREYVMEFLAPEGFDFYIYAPKADLYLRRDWRTLYPEPELARLRTFAEACRNAHVRFGIGLSPYELYKNFDGATKNILVEKIEQLQDTGINELAIFFDDMPGDMADLAPRQVEIMDFVASQSSVNQLSFCPTYYSNDRVLDRVFGSRPASYLESLGRNLDDNIEVFWTGEEVCSREYSAQHLKGIAEKLQRKPILWDNYPVNDGPVKSQYLHIRGFSGRSSDIAEHVCRHAINPALQPHLSLIPALTLASRYAHPDAYSYLEATCDAASRVVNQAFAQKIASDLIALNDTGLDRLEERVETLREAYSGFDHPAAREIIAWLDGQWRLSGSEMEID